MVFVGRLAEQKRLSHLIDAFALVVAQVPKAQLHLFGSGSELPMLQERVAAAGLEDSVVFRGFTHDPAAAFASATVSVMTSLHEGLPLTLTEGMSVGTPFIAYDINYGPAEVIRHGVDGLLVQPGDRWGLADAMVRVLRDRTLAASLRERAYEVAERFSHQRYRNTWIDVVETLGASRRVFQLPGQVPSPSRPVTREGAHV